MIRYEIKKLLKSWLLLAVFAVMLGIFLKYYYNKNINNHCLEAYDGVGITVTAEAYDELKMAVDRAAVMGSNNLFVEAFNAEHPAYIWPIVYKSATDWLQTEEKNQAVIRKAEANIAMYTERGDGYQAAYNELVKKIYEGRRTPYFMDSSGWLAYFSTTENSPLFSMWGLLAVLVSVVGSVSLFTMEKANSTRVIIHTSGRGRTPLYWSKIGVAFGFSAAVMCFFNALVLLICAINGDGIKYWLAPVQSVAHFENCPFNISILGVLLLQLLGRILFVWMVIAFCAFISGKIGNRFVVMGLAVLLIAGMAVLHYTFSLPSQNNDIFLEANYTVQLMDRLAKKWNPFYLLFPKSMYTGLDVVVIFGRPVHRLWVSMLMPCLYIVIFLAGGWSLHNGFPYPYRHKGAVQKTDNEKGTSCEKGGHDDAFESAAV